MDQEWTWTGSGSGPELDNKDLNCKSDFLSDVVIMWATGQAEHQDTGARTIGPGSWLSWSASDSVQLYRQPEPGAALPQLTAQDCCWFCNIRTVYSCTVCNIRTHRVSEKEAFSCLAWLLHGTEIWNKPENTPTKAILQPILCQLSPRQWTWDRDKTFSQLVIRLIWPRNRL